jgi:uncharacterized membrane protein YbhN (UPF0104 family)
MLLLYQVGLEEVRSALALANYLYVAPAVGLYFVTIYFRAIRWRYLLLPLRSFSVGRLYPILVIGYMANNLLPARLGDLVRSYYIARRERISTSSALATVAVEKVYDGVTLLAFASLTAPVLLAFGWFDGISYAWRTTWIVVAALTVGLFAAALAFLTSLVAVPRFVDFVIWWTGLLPAGFRPRAAKSDPQLRRRTEHTKLASPTPRAISTVGACLADRGSHLSFDRLLLRHRSALQLGLGIYPGGVAPDRHLQPGNSRAHGHRRNRHL